jgi:glycosyltransferase involved in cell wall biosynthesis
MSTRLPLSIVVIARNEEMRIGPCLDSASAVADDLVVVDSFSSDRTAEISRSKGARVFTRGWTGYSAQKNFGNAQAEHDWILSLDADERVSAQLAEALRRVFAIGPACDAYAIRFENYFGVQRIRYGAWNPEWHVRLFDRRKCEWNSDEVHEGLRGAEGSRVGRLSGCIQHETVRTQRELEAKSRRYGKLFAAKLRRVGAEPGWTKVWLNPAWRFFRDYVVRLGFLDGRAGLAIAWEAANYTHFKYRWGQSNARAIRGGEWRAAGLAMAAAAVVLAAMPLSAYRDLWRETSRPEILRVNASEDLADNTFEVDLPDILPDDVDEDVLT